MPAAASLPLSPDIVMTVPRAMPLRRNELLLFVGGVCAMGLVSAAGRLTAGAGYAGGIVLPMLLLGPVLLAAIWGLGRWRQYRASVQQGTDRYVLTSTELHVPLVRGRWCVSLAMIDAVEHAALSREVVLRLATGDTQTLAVLDCRAAATFAEALRSGASQARRRLETPIADWQR